MPRRLVTVWRAVLAVLGTLALTSGSFSAVAVPPLAPPAEIPGLVSTHDESSEEVSISPIAVESLGVLDLPSRPADPIMDARVEARPALMPSSEESGAGSGASAGSGIEGPDPIPAGPGVGIWIGSQALAQRPMSGAAWNSLVAAAEGATPNGANLSDQDSNHDVATLAAALVAARTGVAKDRQRAIAALEGAIGTEQGARWLAIGRNLGAYVIAADVLDIRSGPVHDWLRGFLTKRLAHNNDGGSIMLRESAWSSGSNASAQEGFVHAALAAYFGDSGELAWAWNGFRRYAGDRTSPHRMSSNSSYWQADPSDPVGIQNRGATKDGCRLDGAISNDMSRGGEDACVPGYTQYPWVGLNGAVPAAVILARAGYPAWTVGDAALFRAADYLAWLPTVTANPEWYDDGRAAQLKHLLNVAYDLQAPLHLPTGVGQTVGFTDWTHPDRASVGR